MMNWINTTYEEVVGASVYEENYNEENATSLATNTSTKILLSSEFPPGLLAFLSQLRFKVALFLWQKLSIVLAVTSVIGNCFIIAVLSKRKEKHFSTSLFIMSLAFADLFMSGYLIEGFFISNGYIKGSYNNFDCKFRDFLQVLGNGASPLTLTVISIERALCVVMPHKVKTIFTAKVAKILVITVWSICLIKSGLKAYIYAYVVTPFGDVICAIYMADMKVPYRIQTISGQIFKFGTWVINVVCMVIILRALIKNAFVKGKSAKTPITSVTLSLLTVNVVYFIFVTPNMVFDTYQAFFSESAKNVFDLYNRFNLHNIMQFISNVNNVLNFYIYFLVGAKFRQE